MKRIKLISLLLLLAFVMPMNVWAYTRFFGVNIYETGSIQSSAIKSGTVTYDASTATLTLDNVVAEGTNTGISLDFPSFTIKLIGNNVLRSLNSEGIYIQVASNVLITSDCGGSLSLEASQDEALSYGSDQEGTITIKDCSVSLYGKYGIHGWSNGTNTESFNLVVDNSTVKATGSVEEGWRTFYHPSIGNLKSFTLKNCHISQPAGAEFGMDDTEHQYCVYVTEGGKKHAVAETVVIVPGGGEAPVVETCADPVITIKDGKIVATTATTGAACYISYTLKGSSDRTGVDELSLPSLQLVISAVAKAPGMNPSTTVTKTVSFLQGLKGDINDDGELSVDDVTKLVELLMK